MTFKSDGDKWLVINSLRLAAEQYLQDARGASGEGSRAISLADQFLRQAADARRIADQIEQEG